MVLVHSRRARPTIRVLLEDLQDGWASPYPRRRLDEGDDEALHPLSELPHPIVTKAAETFGMTAAEDNPVGPIVSSTRIRLMEVKTGQCRGGVWVDPETGVHWLVVAGLAKGNHADHDDFYVRIAREGAREWRRWLPTERDRRLLKQETAARLLTEWELAVQSRVLDALQCIHTGGTHRFDIDHPVPGQGRLASVTVTVRPVREPDYGSDDIVVEVDSPPRHAGQDLTWQLTIRLLSTLNPPQESWDRFGSTYSNIAEPGHWTARLPKVASAVDRRELIESEPGRLSHYTHRSHIAGSTIEGSAVRALCGANFIPSRDHTALPMCPQCQQRYDWLPR